MKKVKKIKNKSAASRSKPKTSPSKKSDKKPKLPSLSDILKYRSLKVISDADTREVEDRKVRLLQRWLRSGRTITCRQMSRMWGYDRGADGVFKLRKERMKIITTMHYGKDRFLNPVRYAVYHLRKKRKDAGKKRK